MSDAAYWKTMALQRVVGLPLASWTRGAPEKVRRVIDATQEKWGSAPKPSAGPGWLSEDLLPPGTNLFGSAMNRLGVCWSEAVDGAHGLLPAEALRGALRRGLL